MKKISFIILILLTATAVLIGSRSFNSASKETGIPDANESKITEQEAKTSEEGNKDTASSEEDFNNSGQAKAIESETDLWPVFEDAKVGFSFQYPQDATLIAQNESTKDTNNAYYKVDIKDFGQEDVPWDLSKEEAQKNVESLAGGEFGISHEQSLEVSRKVKSVGFLFAQDFVVLSRIDICSVTLERKLLFYFNNKQIAITAYAPIAVLEKSMPEYFMMDKANCGEQLRWNLDKQDAFYQQLANEKAPAEIQQWFDNFDKMAETVIFAHR